MLECYGVSLCNSFSGLESETACMSSSPTQLCSDWPACGRLLGSWTISKLLMLVQVSVWSLVFLHSGYFKCYWQVLALLWQLWLVLDECSCKG